MKKKIFITGAVREYDSNNPQCFANEIKDYIVQHLVNPQSASIINVIVDEPSKNSVRITFPFSVDYPCDSNTISRDMYRVFTGEYSGFRAENSCWWTFGFGPDYPMNVRFGKVEIIDLHRKNTRFYKADRYKSLTIDETPAEMTVTIAF